MLACGHLTSQSNIKNKKLKCKRIVSSNSQLYHFSNFITLQQDHSNKITEYQRALCEYEPLYIQCLTQKSPPGMNAIILRHKTYDIVSSAIL